MPWAHSGACSRYISSDGINSIVPFFEASGRLRWELIWAVAVEFQTSWNCAYRTEGARIERYAKLSCLRIECIGSLPRIAFEAFRLTQQGNEPRAVSKGALRFFMT
jgi:hypothetical protein